mgnify:CR=1 FL=1
MNLERGFDNLDGSKKKIIYYAALLMVYFLLTAAVAVIFEYYTVSVTKGEIIFSLAMSWQLILFVLELITIAIQAVTLIKLIRECTRKRYIIIRNTGIAAAVFAASAVIYVLVKDGLCIYPTLILAVYMLLIVLVRAILIPVSVKQCI